jgi:hypothetical protein
VREWNSFAAKNAWLMAPLCRQVGSLVGRGWTELETSSLSSSSSHRCSSCAPPLPTSAFVSRTPIQYGKNGVKKKGTKTRIGVVENAYQVSF